MRRNNSQSQTPNQSLLRRALVTVNRSYVIQVMHGNFIKPLNALSKQVRQAIQPCIKIKIYK